MSAKISVITPSFNQAQFLPDNLRSVSEQTHPDVEHIVVDPGSSDGSRAIAAASDAILIAEPDRGQSDGITKGFAKATGDVIAWLNSDDFYPSADVLAKVAKTFEDNPDVDIVYGGVDFVDEQGKFLRKGFVNPDPDSLLSSFQYQVGIVQPGVFTRKAVFDQLGGPSEQYEYCMDYEYWVRMANAGLKWLHLPEKLAHHRWWGGMKTSSRRDRSLIEHMRVCAKYFGYIHWKWLDRYAEYLLTQSDGIVHHSNTYDIDDKRAVAADCVRRFITQDMIARLEASEGKEERETLEYIRRSAPREKRYFWNADELQDLRETSDDADAEERRAWRTMFGQDRQGREYATYKVPNNFHRAFDLDWLNRNLEEGRSKLQRLSSERRPVCVIVGNGPSLKLSDLSALEGADVIVSNFAVLNDELMKAASILTVTNDLVAKQGTVDFNALTCAKVVPFWLANSFNATDETAFLRATVEPGFAEFFDETFCWRSTVSYFNMQLAFALGYEKVVLIGFDHSYNQPSNVKEGDLIEQSEDDSNHFDPRYFKDKVWQAADTDNMEKVYELARDAYAKAGREIVNCTVGGKLEVFRRGDLKAEIEEENARAAERFSPKLEKAVETLPGFLRSPIFLPTSRIAPSRQLAGIKRIEQLYSGGLEQHRKRLTRLRSARKGDRCFIIGNGPSLNETDLSLLRDEVTFAVNGFFLKYADIDWRPTYYVVEDHLVAEDRAEQINALAGSTKLFPAYLAYCLSGGDDTIFFDHRPRETFPGPYEFSTDAASRTYAGCTVTFTCMQLAAYLGFKEICLVGVDADYAVPKDVEGRFDHDVGVLDMKSDDPNHFHPDYFGKGYRWHDPQVEEMLKAYGAAKAAVEQNGQSIINAGVGGKLEVFPRKALETVFEDEPRTDAFDRRMRLAEAATRKASAEIEQIKENAPRLLVLDHTPMGDGTATGELKASLFADWPVDRLMQVSDPRADELRIDFDGSTVSMPADAALERVRNFQADIILYRPVPKTASLHDAAMKIIKSSDAPLAVWVMDDWPTALKDAGSDEFDALDPDLRGLLKRASRRFSICEDMSNAYRERYGLEFEPFANGVEPTDWGRPAIRDNEAFVLRYAGSLAENMTLSTVLSVAEAVDKLSLDGLPVRFEIKTRPLWEQRTREAFAPFSQTSFTTTQLSPEQYRAWLSGGDATLMCYNFDDVSKRYVRYSMANKLPECLASGVPFIAVGPRDVATIRYLHDYRQAEIIESDDPDVIGRRLKRLINSPDERLKLAEEAQNFVFKRHNLNRIKADLMNALATMTSSRSDEVTSRPRDSHCHIDETEVVAHMLKDRRGPDHVMVDVGAHYGTSSDYFDKAGWSIFCYEPDPNNRAHLNKRFSDCANVQIDPRAVSDKPASGVQFFRSEQSTGISGLHAFHETHEASGQVDVTTVSDIVIDKKLTHIDFLKIDVEGFDLSVLKGVPWAVLKPDVIECEFEDAKTLKLGHTWKDIADFLQGRGYAVYVSEWHPIVRYGVRHDWRRVAPYEHLNMPDNAWGNLLAFRSDPGYERVKAAFEALLEERAQPIRPDKPVSNCKPTSPDTRAGGVKEPKLLQKTPNGRLESTPAPGALSVNPPAGSTPARPWYANSADSLRQASPRAFSLLRLVRRSLSHVWARRLWTVPALVLFAAAAAATFHSSLSAYGQDLRWALALGVVAAFAGYIGYWARSNLERAAEQIRVLDASRQGYVTQAGLRRSEQTLKSELRSLKLEMERLAADKFSDQLAGIESSLALISDRVGAVDDRLNDAVGALRHEFDAQKAALGSAKADFSQAMENRLESTRTHLWRELNAQKGTLSSTTAELKDVIEGRLESARTHLWRELNAQVGSLNATTADLKKEFEDRLDSNRASVEKALTEVSRINAAVNAQADDFEKRMPADNLRTYQRFNRQLSNQHIDVLSKEWSRKLSTPLTRQSLGYMASRACEMEKRLEGRLATSIEDVLLRAIVAKSARGGRLDVLEIGTLFGTGAAIIYDAVANAFEDKHFTLLDPLDGYYSQAAADIVTGQPITEAVVRKNLSRAGMTDDEYTLIKRLSTEQEALKEAGVREYDLLIIDGDHSYAGVKTDFENYAQFVKLGGHIIFDDYSSEDWPDIKKYVDEEVDSESFVTRVGASWRTAVYRVTQKARKQTPRRSRKPAKEGAET